MEKIKEIWIYLPSIWLIHQEDFAPDLDPGGLPLWTSPPRKASQGFVFVSEPFFRSLGTTKPNIWLFDPPATLQGVHKTPKKQGHIRDCTCNAAWSPWGRTFLCGKLQPQRWPPPLGPGPPRPGGCDWAPARPARRCGRPWPAAPVRAGLVRLVPPPRNSSRRHFCHWETLRWDKVEKGISKRTVNMNDNKTWRLNLDVPRRLLSGKIVQSN